MDNAVMHLLCNGLHAWSRSALRGLSQVMPWPVHGGRQSPPFPEHHEMYPGLRHLGMKPTSMLCASSKISTAFSHLVCRPPRIFPSTR